jgi:hypothetical protein
MNLHFLSHSSSSRALTGNKKTCSTRVEHVRRGSDQHCGLAESTIHAPFPLAIPDRPANWIICVLPYPLRPENLILHPPTLLAGHSCRADERTPAETVQCLLRRSARRVAVVLG